MVRKEESLTLEQEVKGPGIDEWRHVSSGRRE